MGAWRVIYSCGLTSSPPPGPPPATVKWQESMDSQPQNSRNSVYSQRSSASGSLDLLLGSKVQSHQSLTSRMVNLDPEIERFSDTSTTFKNAEFRRPSSIHASSSSSATTIIVSSNNDATYQPGIYKQPKDQPESYHQQLLYTYIPHSLRYHDLFEYLLRTINLVRRCHFRLLSRLRLVRVCGCRYRVSWTVGGSRGRGY